MEFVSLNPSFALVRFAAGRVVDLAIGVLFTVPRESRQADDANDVPRPKALIWVL